MVTLEAVQQGPSSNEYPQHMFLWRNKKHINNFWLKEVPYLELIATAADIKLVGVTNKLPHDKTNKMACVPSKD